MRESKNDRDKYVHFSQLIVNKGKGALILCALSLTFHVSFRCHSPAKKGAGISGNPDR